MPRAGGARAKEKELKALVESCGGTLLDSYAGLEKELNKQDLDRTITMLAHDWGEVSDKVRAVPCTDKVRALDPLLLLDSISLYKLCNISTYSIKGKENAGLSGKVLHGGTVAEQL